MPLYAVLRFEKVQFYDDFQDPKNVRFSIELGQKKSHFWKKLGPKRV